MAGGGGCCGEPVPAAARGSTAVPAAARGSAARAAAASNVPSLRCPRKKAASSRSSYDTWEAAAVAEWEAAAKGEAATAE